MRGTIPTVNEPHADDTRSSEEREHEHSLRGTAVAVALMALFIIATWLGAWLLMLDRR